MAGPNVATVKRLFAVSGNRCAFPGCASPLVDEASGKVTGRICHITADTPGGPRYDPEQSEKERHGFDNLVLMCPLHHDVTDGSPGTYTAERLREIKARHQARYAGGAEPSNATARKIVLEAGGAAPSSLYQLPADLPDFTGQEDVRELVALMQPPRHVFISYSREDQTYTRKLEDSLRGRGFDVWIDDRIDFGERWWQSIVQAICASAAFIVVMTPESARSPWVERELLLALREGKRIFPLLLRGEEFPILINAQYADVRSGQMPREDFYDRLRRELAVVEVPQSPPPQPEVRRGEKVAPGRQPFEPEMVLIPAGEFLMGSDPARDHYATGNEQPQHTVYLPDYYLAKTLVTNVQYAAFLQATSCDLPEHWKGGKPPEAKGDHPVVHVSWHDVVAYCNWLSQATGKPYCLPSEAEWEKGARGTDGRIYPWGDRWDEERCNSVEDGRGDTTPVGAYPRGVSPYGLLDMAGNVVEWTRSLDQEYPYNPKDGREDLEADGLRMLRGGSYGNVSRDVRCAYRRDETPYQRGGCSGFRVCVVAP